MDEGASETTRCAEADRETERPTSSTTVMAGVGVFLGLPAHAASSTAPATQRRVTPRMKKAHPGGAEMGEALRVGAALGCGEAFDGVHEMDVGAAALQQGDELFAQSCFLFAHWFSGRRAFAAAQRTRFRGGFGKILTRDSFQFSAIRVFQLTSPVCPTAPKKGHLARWALSRRNRIRFDVKDLRDVCAAEPTPASFWKHTGEERRGYFSDTRTVCGISEIGCATVREKPASLKTLSSSLKV